MDEIKLTEKQKRFCDYYLENPNATEAAIKAGYSKKTARFIGNENLTKPNIKSYIDIRLKKLEDARIANADEVLKYLTSIMRGKETEQVVVVESIGDFMSEAKTINKDVSAKDRIKAAELLGKRYALFVDKVDVSEPINITIKRKGD